jgi:uncharacterized membrane protein
MHVAQTRQSIDLSRYLVLGAFYGLLLTFVSKTILAISAGGNIAAELFIGAIQTVPLLIFVPGLRAAHLRTHAWLSFVSLLYFTASVTVAFTPGAMAYGILLSVLSMALFIGLVAYIHLVRKHQGGTLQQ